MRYLPEGDSSADDPPHYYVRDTGSRVAHHWDYRRGRTDHALCGYPYQEPAWEGEGRPKAVCRACQDILPAHKARWGQSRAEHLRAEVTSLARETRGVRAQFAKRLQHSENQREELHNLNVKYVGALNPTTAGVEVTLAGMLQSDRDNTSAFDDGECQCMLCDSPEGHADMPVEWSVTIRWIGKVTWVHDGAADGEVAEGGAVLRIDPIAGPDFDESTMLLCDHCTDDWLDQQETGSRGRDLYVVSVCAQIT